MPVIRVGNGELIETLEFEASATETVRVDGVEI